MKTVPGLAPKRAAAPLIATVMLAAILSPAVADTMDAAQIEDKIIDRPLNFKTASGATGEIFYSSSGTSKIDVGDAFTDTGTWRLNGNEFCTKWDIIRAGEEKCTDFRQTSEDSFEVSDGTQVWY